MKNSSKYVGIEERKSENLLILHNHDQSNILVAKSSLKKSSRSPDC